MATVADPCTILNLFTDLQVAILDKIGQKFTSLQRLASILERAGDLADIVSSILQAPNLFLPISALNSIDVYNNIRNACPFLGLPPADADSIYQLQYQLARAYADIMKKLDLHQYNRMDELQARLDDLISDGLDALGRNYITCANVLCSLPSDPTVQAILVDVENSVSTVTGADNQALDVLNSAQKQKVQQLNDAKSFVLTQVDSTNSEITDLFTRWQ